MDTLPRVVVVDVDAVNTTLMVQVVVPVALAASVPLFPGQVPGAAVGRENFPVPAVLLKVITILFRSTLPVLCSVRVWGALVVETAVLKVSGPPVTLAPNVGAADPNSTAPASIAPLMLDSPGSGRRLPKKSRPACGTLAGTRLLAASGA